MFAASMFLAMCGKWDVEMAAVETGQHNEDECGGEE